MKKIHVLISILTKPQSWMTERLPQRFDIKAARRKLKADDELEIKFAYIYEKF